MRHTNWDKVNHGGEPTKNVGEKYAIFIGRFQPYHLGHVNLIEQKLAQGIPVLVMIRDIPPDENNPFTTIETKRMIKKYHAAVGDLVKVITIPDIESVNYGRGVGYEVNEFIPPGDISCISATSIRNQIKEGELEWMNQVPYEIQEDIYKILHNPTNGT